MPIDLPLEPHARSSAETALAALRKGLRTILEALRDEVAEARRMRPHHAYPVIGL